MVKLNTTVFHAKVLGYVNTAKSNKHARCAVHYENLRNVSTTKTSSTVLNVKAEAAVFTGTSKGLAKNAEELIYACICST